MSNGSKFYFASQDSPGMFPEARRWNAHFTGGKMLAQKILTRIGYNVIKSTEIHMVDFSSKTAMLTHLLKKKHVFPVLVKPDRGANSMNISIIENISNLKKVASGHYKDRKDFRSCCVIITARG